MEKIYLSKEGYHKYLDEIEELRKKLVQNSKIKALSASDDAGNGWHDNFSFEEAKREELMIIANIEKKCSLLQLIILLEKHNIKNKVDLLDIVQVKFVDTEELEDYRLVGELNSNLDSIPNEISINSPLGQAIYKKKVGDISHYEINNHKTTIKIIAIN